VAFSTVLDSGGAAFDESALDAVEESAFRPARLSGREIASRVTLRIHFELRD
jgi:TonB family protein